MISATALLTLSLSFILQTAPAAPHEPKPDADGKVSNPEYVSWSRYKPGTVVVHKQLSKDSQDVAGQVDATGEPNQQTEEEITYKVLSSDKDSVVLEVVSKTIEETSTTEAAPVKVTYPAKIKAPAKGAIAAFAEGDEEIEFQGKKIKAHWVESTIKVASETSTEKVWTSDSVPGYIIKKVTTKKEGDKVLTEVNLTVVSIAEAK